MTSKQEKQVCDPITNNVNIKSVRPYSQKIIVFVFLTWGINVNLNCFHGPSSMFDLMKYAIIKMNLNEILNLS